MSYHPETPKDMPEAYEIYKEIDTNWDETTLPTGWLLRRIHDELKAGNVDAEWKVRAKRDFDNWERSLPDEARRPGGNPSG
jgi:hypothetical protein